MRLSYKTNFILLVIVATAIISIDCNRPHTQQRSILVNYFRQSDPLTVKIQILNRTSILSSYSFPLVYSLDQPQQSVTISVPVHADMDNYTIVASVWDERSNKPLSYSTRNLTRYSKIRHGKQTNLMMMDAGIQQQPDQNSTYGLHLPVRYSLLVLYLQSAIPNSNNQFFWMFNFTKVDRSLNYIIPVDLSQMHVPYKSYKSISSINNHSHQIQFNLKVYSFFYYQIFYGLTNRQLLMKSNPLMAQIYTDQTIDMIKQIIFDNHLYVLILYFGLSFIQIFMQIFAFKNEIKVWKQIEKNQGLSIKSLYQSFVCQVIVCLYLFDKQANKLYLIFHLFDLVLTVWKILKAIKVTISRQNRFIIKFQYKQWYHRKIESIDSEAIHYTNYLIAILYSLFMIYKLYPVAQTGFTYYSKHQTIPIPSIKQLYSFLLQSSVMFIFVLGFVMMTPQLYINYKLKSVDHLPWKTLIYRFISTIIDDIFVFMIELPWLQRMFSFRDDIIFICYMVQRRIYKTDKNRTASIAPQNTIAPQTAIPQQTAAELQKKQA